MREYGGDSTRSSSSTVRGSVPKDKHEVGDRVAVVSS